MKYDGIRAEPTEDKSASSVATGEARGIRGAAGRASGKIRGAGSGEAGGQMSDSGAATGSPVGGGKLLARGIDTFVKELGAATPDQLRTLGITPELAKRILDAVSSGAKY